eukprot:scaffold94379_cov40-Phaeocystis_antarctica.AAC.1
MKPTHVRCVRTARVAHARRMHSYTRSCDARSWCSGCARELVLCCAQVLTTGFVMGSVHAFRTRTAPSRHPPYRRGRLASRWGGCLPGSCVTLAPGLGLCWMHTCTVVAVRWCAGTVARGTPQP